MKFGYDDKIPLKFSIKFRNYFAGTFIVQSMIIRLCQMKLLSVISYKINQTEDLKYLQSVFSSMIQLLNGEVNFSRNKTRIEFRNFRGHSICQIVILSWVTDRIWIIESVPSTSTGLEVWYLSKQSYSNLILKHALIPPPRYTDISIGGGKSHHWDISVYSSDFTGRVF